MISHLRDASRVWVFEGYVLIPFGYVLRGSYNLLVLVGYNYLSILQFMIPFRSIYYPRTFVARESNPCVETILNKR